ncbi:MAG: hypothetical protein JW940_07285, partial [Polyangiaceae bacterium]|nr:hypothetical protein [Polyangiaceae bacterium]
PNRRGLHLPAWNTFPAQWKAELDAVALARRGMKLAFSPGMRQEKRMCSWRVCRLALGLSAVGTIIVACGSSSDSASSMPTSRAGTGGMSSGTGTGTDTGTATGGPTWGTGGTPIPQEVEEDVEFELPHAGKRYVYAANPEHDSVAVIDGTTLAIDTVEVGDGPRFLQTLPSSDDESDAAIVLNVKSSDATVIRTKSGKSQTSLVKVAPDSNAIAVSPDGQHAVVYLNPDHSTGDPGALQSQSVSVLTLEPGNDRSTNLSVGFGPSSVSFSQDNSRAFVVTDDGVSILDFSDIDESGPNAAPTVPVSRDISAHALDVSITHDGHYAVAREQGSAVLRLVDLEAQTSYQLDLTPVVNQAVAAPGAADDTDPNETGTAGNSSAGASAGGAAGQPSDAAGSPSALQGGSGNAAASKIVEVTDIDLSPRNDAAIAVVRSDDIVLTIPIPGAFTDPSLITTLRLNAGLVGSVTVSPDAKWALLYTTVDETQEHLTILNLDSREIRTIDLRKSIRAVAVDEDSQIALVLHQKLDANPEESNDADTRIDRSYGYSLVDIESGFARLQTTPCEISAFDLIPAAEKLFVLLKDQWQVQCMSLTSFVPEDLTLASRPLSIGAVPASEKVFVGQDHPDGRITFIDWSTLAMTSVTGFELNSEIEER